MAAMTDSDTQTKVSTATEDNGIDPFVGPNSEYYGVQFDKLNATTKFIPSFNLTAALLGPFWWSARHLWGAFWIFFVAEVVMFVQICRGLFANLGADQMERGVRLESIAKTRRAEAEEALASGADNANILAESASALENASKEAFGQAVELAASAPLLLVYAIVAILLLKGIQGLLANRAMNARYQKWCADPSLPAGFNIFPTIFMTAFITLTYGLTAFRFASASAPEWLKIFPANRTWRLQAESLIDLSFQWMTETWSVFFLNLTAIIKLLLNGMETILVVSPWPVVMAVIIVMAFKIAGARVAIFTAASLAYLAVFGFWDRSMSTIALLGTAAVLCIFFGIPLGILCARNRTVYAIVRPILDLMQTMPSFVYLIPVIAFFGIGKPPGILATIVFGMPPVVRLTVLGLKGVPESVREAAEAFGVSKPYMLFKVDLPLAMPSIMAGINQTILMCLTMVVIAALIGAKGLGEEVLDALTYANEGQGVLAGIAILLCAMVLDRIVQGKGEERK